MKKSNYGKAFLIFIVGIIGCLGMLLVPCIKFFGGSIPNYIPLVIFFSLVVIGLMERRKIDK